MLFFGLSGPMGDSSQGADYAAPIAKVGNVNITAGEFIEHYNRLAQSQTMGDTRPTAQELVASGAVDHLVDQLIRQGVFRAKAEEIGLVMDQTYLDEAFKKYAMFQTNGQYDARKFNNIVEQMKRRKVDWAQQYALVNNDVRNRLHSQSVIASARVLDRDLKTQFEQSVTKLRVRVAAIEPKVEQEEPAYEAYYEENKHRYLTEAERVAEFVAIPIKAPKPELARELIDRAKAGEDFAELAKANSQSSTKTTGGDRGWITQDVTARRHEASLFELEEGDISEPIQVGNAFYIFKIEEKRTREPDDTLEIRVREIQLTSNLDPTQKEAQENIANASATVAKESNELRSIVEDQGLEIRTTDSFAASALNIENIDSADTRSFVPAVSALQVGGISDVITGTHNLYVARVTEYTDPQQKTYEEARDQVVLAVDASYRRTAPEYQADILTYITGVTEGATSLDEIKTLYPELELKIVDTGEFGRNDTTNLFRSGVLIEAAKLIDPLMDSEPGTMVGPIAGFGRTYFAELVERVNPDEEAYEEQWTTREPQLRGSVLAALQQERYSDYLLHLSEKALERGIVQRDTALIERVLGLNQPAVPATSTPDTTATQPDEQTATQ
jgi:peptidyl-prolyl cis-trans isomerase D